MIYVIRVIIDGKQAWGVPGIEGQPLLANIGDTVTCGAKETDVATVKSRHFNYNIDSCTVLLHCERK